jgi:hypothetical protein
MLHWCVEKTPIIVIALAVTGYWLIGTDYLNTGRQTGYTLIKQRQQP